MKKTLTVILLLILSLALVSCGLVEYRNDDIGLSYSLPEEFERYPYGKNNVLTYKNTDGTCAVVITYYTYDEVKPLFDGEDFTLPEYVQHSFKELGLEGSGIEETYNNERTRATFEVATGADASEMPQSSYNIIILERGMLYIVQMVCSANDYEGYLPKFQKWGKEIYTY